MTRIYSPYTVRMTSTEEYVLESQSVILRLLPCALPSELRSRGHATTRTRMNGAPTDIPPPEQLSILTVAQAVNGPPISPQQRILLYSADEWEDFIQEWVHSIPLGTYLDVKRFTGAGDRGIDKH